MRHLPFHRFRPRLRPSNPLWACVLQCLLNAMRMRQFTGQDSRFPRRGQDILRINRYTGRYAIGVGDRLRDLVPDTFLENRNGRWHQIGLQVSINYWTNNAATQANRHVGHVRQKSVVLHPDPAPKALGPHRPQACGWGPWTTYPPPVFRGGALDHSSAHLPQHVMYVVQLLNFTLGRSIPSAGHLTPSMQTNSGKGLVHGAISDARVGDARRGCRHAIDPHEGDSA